MSGDPRFPVLTVTLRLVIIAGSYEPKWQWETKDAWLGSPEFPTLREADAWIAEHHPGVRCDISILAADPNCRPRSA